jgi:hypothetical protein
LVEDGSFARLEAMAGRSTGAVAAELCALSISAMKAFSAWLRYRSR